MKKFISLVMALVMALSLTTVAWGELTAMPGAVDNKIVLEDDVVLTSTYEVADTLTIDLNGHTISGTDTTALYSLIHVKNGANLTIKDSVGTGKISYDAGVENKTGVAVWVEGALTLESGTIEITGDWVIGFAVDVRPNAWGTAYTEAASFTMNGGKIVASDSGVRVTSNSSDSYANLGVTFTMNNGTIESAYDGIFVQNVGYDDTLNVEVVDGTVTSENTHAVRVYENSAGKVDVKMSVTGGSFTGKMTNLDQTGSAGEVAISGGTFTDDVSDYVADGKAAISTDGKFVIATKTTSGSGSETTLKDKDGYDIYAVDGTTSVKAADADITRKITGNAIASNGTVTYTATTYSDGANVYVEVDSSVADFKLMKGNTIVAYLVNLSSVGDIPTTTKTVSSYVKAVKDAKCGQYSETIYPAGVYMIGGKAYAADAGNSWALYNGKFVNYGGEATAVSHTYAVNTYNTTDRSVTTLKCSVCKQVFTVLTPAQVKTMAPSAYAQVTADGGTYFIAVASATAGTNGGTVNSADTFDAGIALYVGMSVMAAAGSAVVLKKKD